MELATRGCGCCSLIVIVGLLVVIGMTYTGIWKAINNKRPIDIGPFQEPAPQVPAEPAAEPERDLVEELELQPSDQRDVNTPSELPEDDQSHQDTEFRTWTSADGRFSIEAICEKVVDETVYLRKKNGTVVRVPMTKLSDADRQWLSESDMQKNK